VGGGYFLLRHVGRRLKRKAGGGPPPPRTDQKDMIMKYTRIKASHGIAKTDYICIDDGYTVAVKGIEATKESGFVWRWADEPLTGMFNDRAVRLKLAVDAVVAMVGNGDGWTSVSMKIGLITWTAWQISETEGNLIVKAADRDAKE
jgi:hypothetical protein